MAAYILLSYLGKICDMAAKELKKAITDTKSLLFIASNPQSFNKIDEYSQRMFGNFKDFGIDFDSYAKLDKRMPDSKQKNAVEKASCVFLMGGETLTQFEYLKQQDLIEPLLNHKGVIIGLSAGAINMAKRSVIANPDYPPVTIYAGIGLVDITVIPHFETVTAGYIKNEILPLTHNGIIYGMCDDSIIITDGKTKKHIGTIYELTPGNMKLLPDSGEIN